MTQIENERYFDGAPSLPDQLQRKVQQVIQEAQEQSNRTWCYYHKMRKSDPERYQRSQQQMIDDYMALGNKFEDGDFHTMWNAACGSALSRMRVNVVKQHQSHQGQSGPNECENAEDDGCDTSQQQDPPAPGERVQHGAVGERDGRYCLHGIHLVEAGFAAGITRLLQR